MCRPPRALAVVREAITALAASLRWEREEVSARPHIYLARHGQTVSNSEGRIQGHSDSPLTPLGIEQARQLGGILRNALGAATDLPLITSPLGRAWQTGVIAADALGRAPLDLRRDERLMERKFGLFEGKCWEQIARDHPREYALYQGEDPNFQVPGGESVVEVRTRLGEWLAAQPPERPRVVFTHGNAGRLLIGLYLSWEGDCWRELPETQGVIFHLKAGEMKILSA